VSLIFETFFGGKKMIIPYRRVTASILPMGRVLPRYETNFGLQKAFRRYRDYYIRRGVPRRPSSFICRPHG